MIDPEILDIPFGKLPSGIDQSFKVYKYKSGKPGPGILFLGGIHGDETNGVEIVRRAISDQFFNRIQVGQVVAIPLLSVQAFNQFTRALNGSHDVNRSFPGRESGTLATQLAYVLSRLVLEEIDFGVDFHTGGGQNFNFPHIRYTIGDDAAWALAKVFGAPMNVAKKALPKSFRKHALEQGKPILVFEGGESLRYDRLSVETGLKGIQRLLLYYKMISGKYFDVAQIEIGQTTWLRAKSSGIFNFFKMSGDRVAKGEVLGVINDPFGTNSVEVISNKDAFIIGHTNAAVIHQGDALFHLGTEN